jgi:hypothetical protein
MRTIERQLALCAGLAVAAFALLAGRFWHPYYGFTRFLQIDETDAAAAIPELRAAPVFVYRGSDGYDGAAYAQIAFHPLLGSRALGPAVGNLPYRARRILGSALAWALARGNPEHIANTYAALNLGAWLALAGLSWALLPVRDWRGFAAWAGLLFSAGALHSVRLALSDLPGLAVLAAALLLAEGRRPRAALGFLALAGLARETVLTGAAGLWRGPWNSARAWAANAGRAAIAAAPLAAWMLYVRWKAGPAPQGLGNFTWPLVGLAWKWRDTFAAFARQPEFFWLDAATLLALAGLTAQAAYLFRRTKFGLWWRVGAASAALMMFFGRSVWEGNPGAATRVLLPMGLAFAVLSTRERARPAWILAGNLSVLSGVLALWHVPEDRRELGAGRLEHGAYLVRAGDGWFGRESNGRHVWSWSGGSARLAVETWPASPSPLKGRIGLLALSPRALEIRQGAALLWRGEIGTKRRWIELSGVRPGEPLRFATDAPPIREGSGPGARALGFAICDPEFE